MFPTRWRSEGCARTVVTALVVLSMAVFHGACTTTSTLTFDGGSDATSDGTGSGDATPGSDAGADGGDAARAECVFDRDGSLFNNGCGFGP